MIALSNNDMNSTWDNFKQIRADYLWKQDYGKYYSCSSFIDEQDINNNFEKLAEILNLSNATEKVLDISLEKIEDGAKMFLYLNSCPSTLSLKLKQTFSSFDAYTVIMSIMKLLKSSKGKKLETFIKIFNAVSDKYGNKYSKITYEETTKKQELYKNITVLNG